nr:alpha-L-rhamnosidase N-terminal domain-containing protein [uncultured Flavobacterium sp.]
MKKFYFKLIIILTAVFFSINGNSQSNESNWLQKEWKALWITVSEVNNTDYGVYLFRKSFQLSSVPTSFPVYVSADNHYKLYVNGKLVSLGPARGDLLHWNFETVDLSPYLISGNNIVSAQVWNEGDSRAEGSISLQTGFILQGNTIDSQILNTNESWKCIQDMSYTSAPVTLSEYYVAGSGEQVNMNKAIIGWSNSSFEDSYWKNAKLIGFGYPKDKIGFGGPNGWLLVPSILPQMELKKQRLNQLRKSEGVVIASTFPKKQQQIIIPANTEATILLDQSFLTNAYPTLVFSGGINSDITIGYAESLYDSPHRKGNRDEIVNKKFIGREDSIISNGKINQEFTTLSWRTYRYINLRIVTKDKPLFLEDIYGTFIGYPFQLKAKLTTDSDELTKMFEIGWRTARLCAVDTYMDCPYYEQLQYIGDTRIQGMVSLYNSGDDRLFKNAINLIDYSRQPEGVTLSRYPTNNPQYITPFSLLYIGMLHDYMMYGKDLDFIKKKLQASRQILNYFEKFQQLDGSIHNLPWWNFTDWVNNDENWIFGVRKYGNDGNSAVIDMQLLLAYQNAAELEEKIGINELSLFYQKKVEQLKRTIYDKYWDKSRNLFADSFEKDLFSQHTNALAILTGLVSDKDLDLVRRKLLTDKTLAPASIYFKYYLHMALNKAGFGNDYLNWLDKWRENIKKGLTTWGETSDVDSTRSDCHAWGASPNIEFFRTILGIDSEAPGFLKVKIEPHLGLIKSIGGEMPHPNGIIRVKYKEIKGHLNVEIDFPVNTIGRFVWKGKNYELKSGLNTFKI